MYKRQIQEKGTLEKGTLEKGILFGCKMCLPPRIFPNFKALYRHFWNYDGIFNTDVKTVSEHKSTIGLKTVEYSPDSPDSHEESFDNDINNNINSQTQDETHDGIGQNKNSFWHKQG